MGHTRLEFLPLLLCPCSQKSFFQGWWWCLQLSTGSWASLNISLDDYSNLEMCTFGRSSSFVCLFFVLFLSYHKASFHYFSRCFRWCLKPFQIKFSQDSLVLSRPEQSVSAWQRRWEPSKQGLWELIKDCILKLKLESNSEPERARVSQRVAMRAGGSQREPDRASGSQSGSHRDNQKEPQWVNESSQAAAMRARLSFVVTR